MSDCVVADHEVEDGDDLAHYGDNDDLRHHPLEARRRT
jgi:hypothetical protein